MIKTERFTEAMAKIHDVISSEWHLLEKKELLGSKGALQDGGSDSDEFRELVRKSSDTSFTLLVMGRFSSGKSSFINVLLGERLLPEGARPMTALITEIYYGSEKRVVMYPRAEKWEGGGEPFEIEPTLSEIKRYSTINNKGGLNKKEANRVESCFEKMVIYWPLEMLRDGVTIVDSPGTDDPYSNDYIVESYVPRADAILYCTPGNNAYDKTDKNTLERINSIGFKNPIIVTTYFDVVTEDQDEDEIDDFVDDTLRWYSRHTTKDCCHYVNSRQGLEAKQAHDKEAFEESGYNGLEGFLGKYLTENRGKEKIENLTSMTEIFNDEKIKRINGIMTNLDIPLEEFGERIAEANKKLENAQQQGENLKRMFREETERAKEKIKLLIPSLYETLYYGTNLEGFEPDTSFALWSPKVSSIQIAEECTKELDTRRKAVISEWNDSVLTPAMTECFKEIVEKLQSGFDVFENDIKTAGITLSAVREDKQDGKKDTSIALFAYALVTGDWMNAVLGGTFGAGAIGRAAVCQFAAGVIFGIAAAFTPVGLPLVVVGSLIAIIASIGWNAALASKTIKDRTVKESVKAVEDMRESIISEATEQCFKVFDGAETELERAINNDIETVRENIDVIVREREDSSHNIEERRSDLAEVIDFLNDTNTEMERIRSGFSIKEPPKKKARMFSLARDII